MESDRSSIVLQAIVGLMLGGSCGFFTAVKALSFIRGKTNRVSVGFDLTAIAEAVAGVILGSLGGALIGLFTALWLATR